VIVVLSSDISYNLDQFAKKLAVNLGAVYRPLNDDFLLKNTGFFEEPKHGKIIFSGHVIASRLKVPAIKIFLQESQESINNRIAKEEGCSLEDAKVKHLELLKKEKERMLKLFGVDLQNKNVYDLIIRIDNLNQKALMYVLEKYIAKRSEN